MIKIYFGGNIMNTTGASETIIARTMNVKNI
jgi:hypothetical protein